MTRIKRNL